MSVYRLELKLLKSANIILLFFDFRFVDLLINTPIYKACNLITVDNVVTINIKQ